MVIKAIGYNLMAIKAIGSHWLQFTSKFLFGGKEKRGNYNLAKTENYKTLKTSRLRNFVLN